MSTPNHIGQKIKEFRTRAGKSQLELEVEIGAAPGSLSRIESGKTNPTKETIFRIAEKLNLAHQEVSRILGIESFSSSEISAGIIFEKNVLLDLIKSELTDKLLAKFIPKLLDQLERKMDYLGASLSLIDTNEMTIQLKYFTNTKLSEFTKRKLLSKKGFRKLSLKAEITLTKLAVLEDRMIIGDNLAEFTSPPLGRLLANLIQKTYGMKTIMAVPVHDEKSKTIAVLNIGTTSRKEDISKAEINWIQDFAKEIGPIVSKLLIR